MSQNIVVHQRIESLDILRSIAILWVVAAHCPFFPLGSFLQKVAGWGSLGVNLFFVLSGYLIASQWFLELRENDGRGSYLRFFVRRTFRIWPNYFIVLALFYVFYGAGENGISNLWHYLFFVQNFYATEGLGITWSLCIEEHFYLLFPIISAFAFRRGVKVSVFIFCFLIFLSVFSRFILWLTIRPDQISLTSPEAAEKAYYLYFYHPTFTRLDGLLFGVAIAALYRFQPDVWKKLVQWGNWWLVAAFVLFFLTVCIGSGTLGKYLPEFLLSPGAAPGKGLLPTTFATFGFDLSFAFLLIGGLSHGSLLHRLHLPFSYSTAVLSFAIYLTHSEVIYWTSGILPRIGVVGRGWLPVIIMLAAIYLVAAALYWLIEKPFLMLRDKKGWVLRRTATVRLGHYK